LVSAPIERTIPASVHGRYLVAPAAAAGPAPLLVGFHGYGENAEIGLERLKGIPAADARWMLVSAQGLHPFYRSRGREAVVASWMTTEQRALAIADNIAYVTALVDAVAREWAVGSTLVFAGFSQGAVMAYRAAAAWPRPVSGVIAAGGDLPPELDVAALSRMPPTLLGRGTLDDRYPSDAFDADRRRLHDAGVQARAVDFEGGHEWPAAFSADASRFLDALTR
jgi:predicted esterase